MHRLTQAVLAIELTCLLLERGLTAIRRLLTSAVKLMCILICLVIMVQTLWHVLI